VAVARPQNMRTINADPAAMAQYGSRQARLADHGPKSDASAVTLSFGALDPTQKYRYSLAKRRANSTTTVFLTDLKTFTDLTGRSACCVPYVFNTADETIRRLEFAWVWTGAKTDPEKAKDADAKPQVGDESTLMRSSVRATARGNLTSPKESRKPTRKRWTGSSSNCSMRPAALH